MDLVVAGSDLAVLNVKVLEVGFCDHFLVTCRLPAKQPAAAVAVQVEGRKWRNFNIDDFRTDLAKSPLCDDLGRVDTMIIDDLFDHFSPVVITLLDKHAPRYIQRRTKRIHPPWFDEECRTRKRSSRRLDRKYRRIRRPGDRLE